MQNLLLPLLLVLVLGGTLLMGSRKQKRVAQQQKDLQDGIQAGDRVMTTSGLYGTVADTSSETTIDIEIAPGVITTWLRQAVREKVQPVVEEDVVLEDDADSAEVHVENDASSITEAAAEAEQKPAAQVDASLEHGKK